MYCVQNNQISTKRPVELEDDYSLRFIVPLKSSVHQVFLTFVHSSIAYNGFVLSRIAAELKQRRKSMSGEKPKEVSGTATESTGEEAADLPKTMGHMRRNGRHGEGKSFAGKALEERDPGTVMLDDSVLKLVQAKHL